MVTRATCHVPRSAKPHKGSKENNNTFTLTPHHNNFIDTTTCRSIYPTSTSNSWKICIRPTYAIDALESAMVLKTPGSIAGINAGIAGNLFMSGFHATGISLFLDSRPTKGNLAQMLRNTSRGCPGEKKEYRAIGARKRRNAGAGQSGGPQGKETTRVLYGSAEIAYGKGQISRDELVSGIGLQLPLQEITRSQEKTQKPEPSPMPQPIVTSGDAADAQLISSLRDSGLAEEKIQAILQNGKKVVQERRVAEERRIAEEKAKQLFRVRLQAAGLPGTDEIVD
ncbi:hypothetical protein NA57DRAFT_56103 [Rhizodiscina lignyota]|uniref:Uncharacterized protein n=1 Tax=Rhizodiscina lignyota TaxID=1504668 RepID=A0A9P4IH86_9PEZI|nr:hypothetical protein NA57DRAFT_56103 [Rhizodiscina lignyota]